MRAQGQFEISHNSTLFNTNRNIELKQFYPFFSQFKKAYIYKKMEKMYNKSKFTETIVKIIN